MNRGLIILRKDDLKKYASTVSYFGYIFTLRFTKPTLSQQSQWLDLMQTEPFRAYPAEHSHSEILNY